MINDRTGARNSIVWAGAWDILGGNTPQIISEGARMALLIRNGEIVTATDRYVADVLCEGEVVTKIGKGLEAPAGCEVIEAGGKFVFPGFIDPHTHIYLPFMGTFAKDDYTSASQAALIGGTTTII